MHTLCGLVNTTLGTCVFQCFQCKNTKHMT